MSFIFPALSAVLQAGSFTLDKIILSIKGNSYKTYLGISFPLMFIINLIIFFIFKPELSTSFFSLSLLILLLSSIIFSILTNIIFYRALKSDRLSELETISLLGSIPLIIFSAIFFLNERNYPVIALALLASLSIIWSHWRKDHFQIAGKTGLFLFFTLILSPFRGIISKSLLNVWNPISLELVRTGATALILTPFFIKKAEKVSKKTFFFLVLTNMLTTIAWILYFFSYKISGIIYTTLIFSLQPLLVYFSCMLFLKEKFHWKKFTAFLIILAAIAVSQIAK